MDELSTARLLFGLTASVHYLFVAITLGLTPIIATLATVRAIRGDNAVGAIDSLTRIYIANYALGIVSGLVMELQMALLWTGPGTYDYGPIAGLVALETLVAFFLESTLLGLWLAGRPVFGAWVQAAIFWGITLTAYVSVIVIVTANSYLHSPLGGGPVTPAGFAALLFRPAAAWPILHIVATSLVVGAFWAASLGAIQCRADSGSATGRRLIRIGVILAAVTAPVMAISGLMQFPTARAAVPIQEPAGVGVLLAAMIISGFVITLLTWLVILPLVLTGVIFRVRWLLGLLVGGVVVPMLLTVFGWIYRESARQPWFIVGRVSVAEAASPIGQSAMMAASIAFVALSLATAVAAIVAFRRISTGYREVRT